MSNGVHGVNSLPYLRSEIPALARLVGLQMWATLKAADRGRFGEDILAVGTHPLASPFLPQAWVPAAWEVPRAEAGLGQVSGGVDFRANFLRSVSLPRGENGKLG